MNFKENESDRKLRGGYYTPTPIANFLVKWVLTIKPRAILEPSCGDGVFIRAFSMIAKNKIKLIGVELLTKEAAKARKMIFANKHLDVDVLNYNFLEWSLDQIQCGKSFDAIVGNPPYIRYQYLEQRDQKLSEKIFAIYKLKFTKHTNAWVPFIIASIGLLVPGGRLAMVVPSEILHVLHAGSLRNFLLAECLRILMIDPNELLFEDALQGTVLLMISKKDYPQQISQGVAVVAAPNNNFISKDPEEIFEQATYISRNLLNGKWMKVLLGSEELKVFESVRQFSAIKLFSEIAEVDVGIVTGANKFFLVDNATVKKYRLQSFVKPMFGRSEHCPGVVYSQTVHKRNSINNLPTNFIMFDKMAFDNLPIGAKKYIQEGEKQKLHIRYKCRIRTPWYSVPSVYSTDLGMLKRSYHYPRLILNKINAYTTDTAYRIKTSINPTNLVYCFINSLTALAAELEGRHYGGGVLELVPSEIEKLLVPVINIQRALINDLDAKISKVHNPATLLAQQDTKILKAVGLNNNECQVIHEAWVRIRLRRQRLLKEIKEGT